MTRDSTIYALQIMAIATYTRKQSHKILSLVTSLLVRLLMLLKLCHVTCPQTHKI